MRARLKYWSRGRPSASRHNQEKGPLGPSAYRRGRGAMVHTSQGHDSLVLAERGRKALANSGDRSHAAVQFAGTLGPAKVTGEAEGKALLDEGKGEDPAAAEENPMQGEG